MRPILLTLLLLLGGAGAQGPSCEPDEPVEVPDAGPRAALQVALGLVPVGSSEGAGSGPPITCRDLQALTALRVEAPRHVVRSLVGLEHAANLQALALATDPALGPGTHQVHELADLAPLRHVTYLRELHLEGRGPLDIAGPAGLPYLERLTLHGFELPDLEPLAHLRHAEILVLPYASVHDLEPFRRWSGSSGRPFPGAPQLRSQR